MGGSRTAPYEEGLWGRGEGWVPACARTTGRERRGWLWGAIDSSLRFATFRMTCGVRCAQDEMWGSRRDGRFANRPYEEGCGGGERDGSPHARGHGKEEGMGPRMREDTGRERDGSPHARGHGMGEGIGYWKVGSWGRVFTPHPNLPPSRGKGGERGAVCAGRGIVLNYPERGLLHILLKEEGRWSLPNQSLA